jgi:demethylspheroidene O-methyltransferase
MKHWRDLRNDLLANPRFQAFAARFFLTRGITCKRSAQVFDLCAGFVYSQVLQACVSGGVFEFLRNGPRDLSDIAFLLKLESEPALRLMRAGVALGLLEKRGDDRFGLGKHGAALLGNAGALAMVEHHHLLYADLADPLALLRGEKFPTRLQQFWAYARNPDRAGAGESAVAPYSKLMSDSQTLVRRDILDALDLGDVSRLVDIGGGEGAFAAEAATRWPKLSVGVFDLPAVAARAQARFEAMGLGERAKGYGGDFYADALPAGADAYSLVRVLHDHDDDKAKLLLGKIFAALPAGGRLIIAEPMAEAKGAEAMGDAYFGLYLFAMGSGRPRPAGEIERMAKAAGFTATRRIPTPNPLLVSMIECRKKA